MGARSPSFAAYLGHIIAVQAHDNPARIFSADIHVKEHLAASTAFGKPRDTGLITVLQYKLHMVGGHLGCDISLSRHCPDHSLAAACPGGDSLSLQR